MLPDRLFYPLVALAAAGIVALAFVWPQGQGAPVDKHLQSASPLRPAVTTP